MRATEYGVHTPTKDWLRMGFTVVRAVREDEPGGAHFPLFCVTPPTSIPYSVSEIRSGLSRCTH